MTHPAPPPVKSDKSHETNFVSNRDFMAAVFGDKLDEIRPMIVSFMGNPNQVTGSAWRGYMWNSEVKSLPQEANNYFSLATFKRTDQGSYRRQKKHFHALHAVMLDDIGTKVSKERMTLKPSWLLETSPGNYQAGYVLAEPLRDAITADKLMKAIVHAGLCDPGAGGPTARLARFPVAVNSKNTPAFSCRMEQWNPNFLYTLDDLLKGLEIDISADPKPKQKDHKGKFSIGEDIFIPCPEDNAALLSLKNKGLYKASLGDGKHDISCPWVHDHTDSIDHGTAYFEPNNIYPIGGFHCFHGHCSERRVRDLLEYLDVPRSAARMKSIIRCIPGEIHRIVDKAEQELAVPGKYYQRGGLIVTVNTDPTTFETYVKSISQPSLTAALSGAMVWERYDGRSKSWMRIDPPARTVSILFDAHEYRHLSALHGIAHQPYLREDGTLVQKAGYDIATGMYGVFNAQEFDVPESPTKKEAKDALALIETLINEFPFAKDTDHAATLSAVLTSTTRPSLNLAPMYHVRAPQISSGKSFLCEIIGAFASARRAAPSSFPYDDEECRKFLLSEFLRAPAVIEFDNLTTDITAHKSLCTALTSEFLTGRILGVSKTATVNTRALFLSSGNNVGPIQDMVRRCITINLDPACENPASRTYKNPHVLQNLHKDRAKYVSAALTIIRAWITAGRPQAKCSPLASYGQWSELCRQPLLWLGYADPTASLFKTMNEDPDREMLGRLLEEWHGIYGSAPRMVRDIVNIAYTSASPELRDALEDIAYDRDAINRKRLGHWIKRNANKIVNNMRFVRDTGAHSAAAWRVERVTK